MLMIWAVLCRLRSMTVENFAALPDVSEGLENRLYQAARQAGSLEEFYALVKSKRYSHARVRRLCMSAFFRRTKGCALPAPLSAGAGDDPHRSSHSPSGTAQPAPGAADGGLSKLGGEALALFEQEARAGRPVRPLPACPPSLRPRLHPGAHQGGVLGEREDRL